MGRVDLTGTGHSPDGDLLTDGGEELAGDGKTETDRLLRPRLWPTTLNSPKKMGLGASRDIRLRQRCWWPLAPVPRRVEQEIFGVPQRLPRAVSESLALGCRVALCLSPHAGHLRSVPPGRIRDGGTGCLDWARSIGVASSVLWIVEIAKLSRNRLHPAEHSTGAPAGQVTGGPEGWTGNSPVVSAVAAASGETSL